MRSIASLRQQIEDLTLYLSTLKANVRKASVELNVGFSRRSRRPLESALRWKRYRDSTDLQMIAEACLNDLRKAQAMRLAPFGPGDQVIATLTVRGLAPREGRYGIWDVEPGPRGSYAYEAVMITKAGDLSKRMNVQPLLAERFSLYLCDAPLTNEATTALAWRRELCAKFIDQTINHGSMDAYEIEERGFAGYRSVKRRT